MIEKLECVVYGKAARINFVLTSVKENDRGLCVETACPIYYNCGNHGKVSGGKFEPEDKIRLSKMINSIRK